MCGWSTLAESPPASAAAKKRLSGQLTCRNQISFAGKLARACLNKRKVVFNLLTSGEQIVVEVKAFICARRQLLNWPSKELQLLGEQAHPIGFQT